MGLFTNNKETVYPFSGFDGQLLYRGNPAANAKITRSYEQLGGDTHEETIYADSEGRFSFESITSEFKKPVLAPVEYMSHQSIFVEYLGENIQIWGGGKADKSEFAEFGGSSPKQLTCEITGEAKLFELAKGGIVSRCTWK